MSRFKIRIWDNDKKCYLGEMKTVWESDVGLPMTVSEARDIARKALEGAKNE